MIKQTIAALLLTTSMASANEYFNDDGQLIREEDNRLRVLVDLSSEKERDRGLAASHAYSSSLADGQGFGLGVAATGGEPGGAVSYLFELDESHSFNVGLSFGNTGTIAGGFKFKF